MENQWRRPEPGDRNMEHGTRSPYTTPHRDAVQGQFPTRKGTIGGVLFLVMLEHTDAHDPYRDRGGSAYIGPCLAIEGS